MIGRPLCALCASTIYMAYPTDGSNPVAIPA